MKINIHDDEIRKEINTLINGEIRSIARSSIDIAIATELDKRLKYKSQDEFDRYVERTVHNCISRRLQKSYFHEDDTIVKICKDMISAEMNKLDVKDMIEKQIAYRLDNYKLKI